MNKTINRERIPVLASSVDYLLGRVPVSNVSKIVRGFQESVSMIYFYASVRSSQLWTISDKFKLQRTKILDKALPRLGVVKYSWFFKNLSQWNCTFKKVFHSTSGKLFLVEWEVVEAFMKILTKILPFLNYSLYRSM